ncbi:hypothetical protein FRB94_007664 [Tulasnella sp. JGI-2019a]|nr:hypothetical protein FRB93_006906 [Tulasnella sp. JGI-2019a]KAG8997418.1 hypothetical protein FRB94_007664 [Tulasnella sp. JGI-2019a]
MPLSPLLSPPSIFENDHLLINSIPASPIPPISPNLTSAPIAPYEGPPEWTTAAATTLPTMTGMIGHSAQSGLGGDFSQIQYLLQDLRSASSPMPGIVMPLAMPDLAAATVAPKMQEQQPTDDSGMTALMYQIFNPSFL